jgi:DNA-directed RNA polymerase subunit N (RpoN/RPB10)
MQEHPLCPSCLGSISDYMDIYLLLRQHKVDKLIRQKKTNIDAADVLVNYDEDLQDVFDMLGIKNWCCRGHMTAARDFYDYYKNS